MDATKTDVCFCCEESAPGLFSTEVVGEAGGLLLCDGCLEDSFVYCAGCGRYEWAKYGSSYPEIYGEACFCRFCIDEASVCRIDLSTCVPAWDTSHRYHAEPWDNDSCCADQDRPLFVHSGNHGEGMSVSEFLAGQGEKSTVAWKDLLEIFLSRNGRDYAPACGLDFVGDRILVLGQMHAHAKAHPVLANASDWDRPQPTL